MFVQVSQKCSTAARRIGSIVTWVTVEAVNGAA